MDNRSENGSDNGDPGRENGGSGPDDGAFERSLARMVENHLLIGGLCAIVSLFLLNPFIGIIGILFVALAFSKIRQVEQDARVSDAAIGRMRRLMGIVGGACAVVVIVDLVLGQLFAMMAAEYMEALGGTIQDSLSTSQGTTSTWG